MMILVSPVPIIVSSILERQQRETHGSNGTTIFVSPIRSHTECARSVFVVLQERLSSLSFVFRVGRGSFGTRDDEVSECVVGRYTHDCRGTADDG